MSTQALKPREKSDDWNNRIGKRSLIDFKRYLASYR